ncbi:MAG: fungal-specific transcription factor domain-containing protein [Benjaminiella poitrasii]|nr:MAG: fungal-specific transcription factor domain-containing protein [Benjaminiella poitrasii]
MNTFHLHDHMVNQPKEKRLKVSRACFTCRVKKIKCDGLQPCMQCKARKRPCSFSKDGSVDQTQQSPDINYVHTTCSQQHDVFSPRHSPKPRSSPHLSISSSSAQSIDTATQERTSKEQANLRKTLERLDTLSMMWPGEGKEGRWLVDMNLLFSGVNSSENAPKPPYPPSPVNVNKHLLNLYFRHRHAMLPILPKSIFYRLLEHRDPLITPLLLNSMYCHAAHFAHGSTSEANHYFKHAQLLLDTHYMDTPSLSVVIALCLMSTYESSQQGTEARVSKAKTTMYWDMACHMCHDLKLHKRSSSHNTSTTTPDEIELCKRAYWAVYSLDKLKSIMTARPFLLSSKEVDIDFPIILGDSQSDPQEYEISVCFIEHIKLMRLAEHVFQSGVPDRQTVNIMMRSPDTVQRVLNCDSQLMQWLRNLPSALQWTPPLSFTNCSFTTEEQHDMIPTQPPRNALVAYLHLVFNFLHISLLQSVAFSSLSSSSASFMVQRRLSAVATNLTQLTCAMADQPNCILSFHLAAEAIMAAVRVHIIRCADEKPARARNARYMFQRSLRSLRSILHHRVIDGIQTFAATIEKVLADADASQNTSTNITTTSHNNSNSSNRSNSSSPKFHTLSPIIPRINPMNHSLSPTITVTSPISTSLLTQQEHAMTLDGHRWTSKLNNTMYHPYGLVSPVSSTSSAPLDNIKGLHTNIPSRNEDVMRPHLTQHQHSTDMSTSSITTTMSSPFVSTASFAVTANNTSWRPTMACVMGQSSNPHSTVALKYEECTPRHDDQPTEMYSHIWSRPSPAENTIQPFHSTETHADPSFIDTTDKSTQVSSKSNNNNSHTTVQQPDTNNDTSTAMDTDMYSVWNEAAAAVVQKTHKEEDDENNSTAALLAIQQTRFGLGIYASAQQHHTDVIRQHIPGIKSNSSNRPVLLNHFGQVIVAGPDTSQNTV